MHSAELLIELGIFLLVLAGLGRLSGLFGLSPIPLYLLAGLANGSGGLLPLGPTEDFVRVGAEIGVVLLLFTLGLEYSASELIGGLRVGAPAGAVDAVANFTPGFATGLLLGWDLRAALVLGGVTWVSSSGVVAKLLSDLGRVGNRETPAILAVLVVEDLAMAAFLPLIGSLVGGGGVLSVVAALLLAAAAVTLAFWVALHHGPVLSRLVFSRSDEVLLFSVLGLTLAVAGLAEELSVSAAVGAFLVGITFSGPAADGARALLGPLRDLFAGVFFVFFGLSVDPSQLVPVLGPALVLALVTVPTKVATGWWAAARLGVARAGRIRAGATLVARGEFSVVLASLGAGLEEDLLALAAAYVLVTAVTGPVLARFADPLAARLAGPAPTPLPPEE
ncbi:MAG: cation:proton antiporter [Acidimicrobiia bacterium]